MGREKEAYLKMIADSDSDTQVEVLNWTKRISE